MRAAVSWFATVVLLVVFGAGPAWAQKAGAAKRKRGGGQVVEIEEEVIEGRVHKPEAFYILQRSNLNYNALEPRKTFIPKILETVKKEPF